MNKRLLILYLKLISEKKTEKARQLLKLVMTAEEIETYLHYNENRQ